MWQLYIDQRRPQFAQRIGGALDGGSNICGNAMRCDLRSHDAHAQPGQRSAQLLSERFRRRVERRTIALIVAGDDLH